MAATAGGPAPSPDTTSDPSGTTDGNRWARTHPVAPPAPEKAAADDSAGPRHPKPSRPSTRSHLLRRVRGTAAGRATLKILVALAGAVVIAVGIVLIPLPGPGWMIVLGGLAIWSIEFHWAEKLLHYTRDRLARWWHWMGRRSPAVRFLVGLAGLVFIAAIVWASVRVSTGVDLVDVGRNWIKDR